MKTERHENADKAVAYAPNQAFIDNLYPDRLFQTANFHLPTTGPHASRRGDFGEIIPEGEFHGMMRKKDRSRRL